MEQKYYDAFISYRHQPLDKMVAEQTQKLLEEYKPPRSVVEKLGKNRINRIFRDTTELPDCGDLTESLNNALLHSDYLIVVLTPELQKSEYCMQEIRYFKDAHGNRCDHILPILASGDPDESIPDVLRHETRTGVDTDGTEKTIEVEIEPFCCDVRADSIGRTKKKLKTEFLRLAAPLLGCAYDDLYRRQLRRTRRRRVTALLAGFFLVISVLVIVSVFACQTYVTENIRSRLVDTYVRNGAEQIAAKEPQKSMMYYSNALLLDRDTQAAKTGALLLLQQYSWPHFEGSESGKIMGDTVYRGDNPPIALIPDMGTLVYTREGYALSNNEESKNKVISEGNFLNAAKDGSCLVFQKDETITFYFPYVDKHIQIVIPDYTDHDPEYDDENGHNPVEAMAISENRAAIAFLNNLYLYNLDLQTEEAVLFDHYDLYDVFTPDGPKSTLSICLDAWFDEGGKLAVLTNNVTTAVFNIGNEERTALNTLHQAAGEELQAVAFDSSGDYYALAYGNDDGTYGISGGCLEVYDKYGNECMSTEFEGGTPLTGVTFEPNGSRIAAWGNGELQIWNWKTGQKSVATIQLENIENAIWMEDNTLLVDDGKGNILRYAIAEYQAPESMGEINASHVTADYREKEAAITENCFFSHAYSSVYTKDNQGNELDRKKVYELGTDPDPEENGYELINRMFVDQAHQEAYLWYSGKSKLIAVNINDQGEIVSSRRLKIESKKPLAIYAVWNGIVVEMGTGELYYFESGKTESGATMKPNTTGSICEIISNESGLVCFIIRHKSYTKGGSYQDSYSIELWDLNKNVLLTEFAHEEKNEPHNLAFTSDNYLTYDISDRTEKWLINSQMPDDVLINTLSRISCYEIRDNQNTRVRQVAFEPNQLGKWSSYLVEGKLPEKKPEKTVTQRMNELLENEGIDNYMKVFDEWWESAEIENYSIAELVTIYTDYYYTAFHHDMAEKIDIGLAAIIKNILEAEDPGNIAIVNLEYALTHSLVVTDKYRDSVIRYYNGMAEKYEKNAVQNEKIINLLYGCMYRIEARKLQGLKIKAFDLSENALYAPYMELFKDYISYDLFEQIFSGNGAEAARLLDETGVDSNRDYFLLLEELYIHEKMGDISEQTYSDFVKHLKKIYGMRITQITPEQMACNLRLGDFVVAIDGVFFGFPYYATKLEETHLNSTLIVFREGEYIETSDDHSFGFVHDSPQLEEQYQNSTLTVLWEGKYGIYVETKMKEKWDLLGEYPLD